jgi:broad specificity phosphatase PhoE
MVESWQNNYGKFLILMSVLYMVRHGQASFNKNDYDKLSTEGVEQSRLLGDHWASLDLEFDHVYVGPKKRHWQTHDTVAAVYRARGLRWPKAIELKELDEHSGQYVLNRNLPVLMKKDPALKKIALEIKSGSAKAKRDFFKVFQKVTQNWVRGDLDISGFEAWQEFRARVAKAVQKTTRVSGRNRNVVAFTSGGPVAAATGLALDLSDEKTLELSWSIRNSSCTEFLFSGERFSLTIFNNASHLTNRKLWTFI